MSVIQSKMGDVAITKHFPFPSVYYDSKTSQLTFIKVKSRRELVISIISFYHKFIHKFLKPSFTSFRNAFQIPYF